MFSCAFTSIVDQSGTIQVFAHRDAHAQHPVTAGNQLMKQMSPALNQLPVVLKLLANQALGETVSTLIICGDLHDDWEAIWIAIRVMHKLPEVMTLHVETLGSRSDTLVDCQEVCSLIVFAEVAMHLCGI